MANRRNSMLDQQPESQRATKSLKVQLSDPEQVNIIGNHEKKRYSTKCTKCSSTVNKVLDCICNHVPVLNWVPKYDWKNDILRDIISGMTVAVMHLPQGMAYAILGHVPAIHGIYMAFFPVIIYFIFSTSRHVSVGTFAVVCLMTGQIIDKTVKNETSITSNYNEIEVGTAVSFMVGIWHLILYCLRLGIVCSLLSGTLVTSFTTGAAVHVFTSQVKELLGLKLGVHTGIFGIYSNYKEIIFKIKETNMYTLILSSMTIGILAIDAYLFAPWFRKRIKFEFPSQLIVILMANCLSKFIHFEKYGIKVIGHIPQGLPPFKPPPFSLLIEVAEGSFFIMIVSYSVSMSMALLFATALNYKIDANQELLAFGLANVTGSFFQCLPVSTSLARSTVQKLAGGRTQVTSIISCLVLLVVLLWIGPFFEPLPRCVLSGIIVVSLKKMLFQVKLVPKIWKMSKIDAFVWIGTFLSVIIFDVKYGLLTGIVLTLVHVFIQNMTPDAFLLGVVQVSFDAENNSSHKYIFVNAEENGASEITGIKIIHISEGLTFATVNHIKNAICILSGVNPQEILRLRRRMARTKATSEEISDAENVMLMVKFKVQPVSQDDETLMKKDKLRYLILDLKSIKYFDHSGINALQALVVNYKEINISVFIISNCDVLASEVDSINEALRVINSVSPIS